MLMHVYFCILEEKKKEEEGGEPVFEIMENCERFLNFIYCSELKKDLVFQWGIIEMSHVKHRYIRLCWLCLR